jgi:hypothetical protein
MFVERQSAAAVDGQYRSDRASEQTHERDRYHKQQVASEEQHNQAESHGHENRIAPYLDQLLTLLPVLGLL